MQCHMKYGWAQAQCDDCLVQATIAACSEECSIVLLFNFAIKSFLEVLPIGWDPRWMWGAQWDAMRSLVKLHSSGKSQLTQINSDSDYGIVELTVIYHWRENHDDINIQARVGKGAVLDPHLCYQLTFYIQATAHAVEWWLMVKGTAYLISENCSYIA